MINLRIPRAYIAYRGLVRLVFVIDKCIQPRAYGRGDDDRHLGVGIRRFRYRPVTAPPKGLTENNSKSQFVVDQFVIGTRDEYGSVLPLD